MSAAEMDRHAVEALRRKVEQLEQDLYDERVKNWQLRGEQGEAPAPPRPVGERSAA